MFNVWWWWFNVSLVILLITIVTTQIINQNANIPTKSTKLSNKLAIMAIEVKRSGKNEYRVTSSNDIISLQNYKEKEETSTKAAMKSDKLANMTFEFKNDSNINEDNNIISKDTSYATTIATNIQRRTIKSSKQTKATERNLRRFPRKKQSSQTYAQKAKYMKEKHSKSITEFFKSLERDQKLHRVASSSDKRINYSINISKDADNHVKSLIHITTSSDYNTNPVEYTENPKTTVETVSEYDAIEDAVQQKFEIVVTPETIYNTFEPLNTPQPEVHYSNKGKHKMKINFNIGEVKIAIDAPGNMSSEEQVVKFAQKMYENLQELRNNKIDKINFTKYDRPSDIQFPDDNDTRKEHENPYAEIIHHSSNEASHGGQYHKVAALLMKKVRVLCWVMTHPTRHDTHAAHVKATWGKRCNKLIFMSTAKEVHLPAINLYVRDGRDNHWEMTKEAFSYIFKHHRYEAEWFLKADDDTYVIMENLRYMLAEYNSSEPMYFGCRFKPYTKQGYMSGGAGYVLSRAALDRLNRAFQIPNMCSTILTSAEDVELGKCMERIGVRAMDSRDPFGRGRFFPFPPREHLVPDREKNAWYFNYLYYPTKDGIHCCSNTAISFHGLDSRDMYVMEYLVYHLKPYETPLLDDENTMKRTHFTIKTSDGAVYGRKKEKILPVAEVHYNTFD